MILRLLYTVCFYLALPLILLRLLWRGIKAPAYRRRWAERFGWIQPPRFERPLWWLHSVSVGETIAAAPLVERLLARGDCQLVITTTTPTGSAEVQKRFGDRVYHVYAPYDLPDCLGRFLKRLQPQVCIVMETEIWPNWVHACQRRQIPVILANGRLSAKSARGYQRVKGLIGPAFAGLSVVAAQHEDDARRFIELGVEPGSCQVTGSIKFDLSLDEALQARAAAERQALQLQGPRRVFIAASTHRGEDAPVLQAFQQLQIQYPDLLLLLVPRHPERFDEVVELANRQGLVVQRRSANQPLAADTQVLVGDTMGELMLLYGTADVAFVGGSLVPVGGHNLVEPAAWGLPIITGPHLFNFTEISRLLHAQNAIREVADEAALRGVLGDLLSHPEHCEAMAANAQAVARANRGALDRLLLLIDQFR